MTPVSAKNKAVAWWLIIGVVMIIIQTLLGGVTRLTGSGLSITEWNVVTGTLPPLNAQDWAAEFAKYQASPQYQYLNADFTLSDFKFIFFWEWFHRLWARLIGFVFVIPFVYFIVKKYFNREMIMPLIVLFLLGALQGMVGWIMVASGLTGDAIYVKPTRLAIHFVLAMLLGCYVLWFALQLLVPAGQVLVHPRLKRWYQVIFVLLLVQLIYGALMAGHRAAPAASTWPTINGFWWPGGMGRSENAHPLIENKITIHFIHRGLAYLLLTFTVIAMVLAYRVKNPAPAIRYSRWQPLAWVGIQVLLGILTVLSSPMIVANRWGIFQTLAQLHQLVAMFFLLSVTLQLYLFRARE